MDFELKDITKIYIIESPSSTDILDNRKEGYALSEILKLADIQNQYYNVVERKNLFECLNRIQNDTKTISGGLGHVIIHVSMHGNGEGIGLTSGDFISWKEFAEILKDFNETLGYIDFGGGLKCSRIAINMSSCKGFNAKTINKYSMESLYTTLVGPTESVNWSDSLLAFATYYHNTIHRTNTIRVAVDVMNSSAGLENIFQVDAAKGLKIK